MEREKADRIASISNLLSQANVRHIRHQRQHLAQRAAAFRSPQDIRSLIENKGVVFTNEEILQNFTDVKR